MAVLIVCDSVDRHVSSIAWALRQYGNKPGIWRPAPPKARPGSVRFDSASVNYHFPAEGGDITPSSIDAVWMRHWPDPAFPPGFREEGRKASRNALLAYHRGLLELLPKGILWANPIASGGAASFRLNQFAAAASVGLAIPQSLVTDDAAQAKAFVAAQPGGKFIYEPSCRSHGEQRDDKIQTRVTGPITAADLDIPEALVRSPGIFQAITPKAYELKVSVFGRTCISAKIHAREPIGWRTRRRDMQVAPYALPEAVQRKLHAFMDSLGIVMGMFDFIVTPKGDHVFIEANEQGRFLWIEEMCPALPLLDISARFLSSGDPYFWTDVVSGFGLKAADYREEEAA